MSYFKINERGKNQYENLGEVRIHTSLCPVLSLFILGFCIIFLILSAWNFNNAINETNNVHVWYLNLKRSPRYVVSDKFLSFGLDTSLLRDMENLPIKNEKFINLARYLAPAYVRVGGTSSDCLFFDQTMQISNATTISPVDGADISNFTITDVDFENLYSFATKSKLRMIFDLNVLIRDETDKWSDINARNIISFAKEKRMKLDWQLGNAETSTAYGGGAPELSDRFVAGFLWLDKLGYSASTGVNVVTRQSLFGGNYAMIGPDLIPNPDWWVSVVYKQFVSEKVLKISSPNDLGGIRLYAHCTPEKALINRVPAFTIYGVNIYKVPTKIIIHGILPILRKGAKIFFYALTSDHLQSRVIKMNGKTLKLQPDGNLPSFWPVILEPTEKITLPPYSMVFVVIHGVEIPECKT